MSETLVARSINVVHVTKLPLRLLVWHQSLTTFTSATCSKHQRLDPGSWKLVLSVAKWMSQIYSILGFHLLKLISAVIIF